MSHREKIEHHEQKSEKSLQKEAKMASKKKGGTFRKAAKYFLLILIIGLIFFFISGYYFLNTTAGLKQAINLTNRYTNYHIESYEINGTLLGTATLKGFSITGENLDFRSQEIQLGWRPAQLFSQKLQIDSIALKDSQLTLFPRTEDDVEKDLSDYTPFDLTDTDLPITLNLEKIVVENFVFQAPGAGGKDNTKPIPPIFVIRRMEAGIDYTGQTGSIRHFTLDSPEMEASVSGEIKTKGNYPLNLHLVVDYHHDTYGKEMLMMDITGELKNKINLIVKGKGLSDFVIDTQVQSLLSYPQFTGKVLLDKLDASHLGLPDSKTTANIEFSGKYGQSLIMDSRGSISHDSPKTDKIKLDVAAKMDENHVYLSQLTLYLLTAKQQIDATGHFNPKTQEINFKLSSPEISWPQQQILPKQWLAKTLRMTVQGKLDDYKITAVSDVDTQFAGNLPVTVTALGSQQKVRDINAKVLVNEQPIQLTGEFAWQPILDYQFALNATSIKPFRQFPGIKKLNLVAQGKDTDYQAKGGLSIYSKTLPSSDIRLDTKGDFSRLDKTSLTIKTLGGEIAVNASGDLSPLNVVADLVAKNIQPHQFYPDIKGNISGKIHTTAKQDEQNQQPLIATANIQSLTGKLQGSPVVGRGMVTYNDENQRITIDDLFLELAKNKLIANGKMEISPTSKDNYLSAKLNGRNLQSLFPQLRGTVIADIIAKGGLSKPDIQATIDANNLVYQDYKVKSLNTTATIDFARDKLQVKTFAKQLTVQKENINTVKLDIDGKLSQHRINVVVETPETAEIPTLSLNAKGGLSNGMSKWQGVLQKLNLKSKYAGQWQTPKSSKLSLSSEEIIADKICLQQKDASICAKTQLIKQTGNIDVDINNLKTSTFAKLLPKNIQIDTTVNGDARIYLNNGKPDIKGQLAAKGGKLSVYTSNGGMVSKIERLSSKIAMKNSRLESITEAKLEKLGRLNIKAVVPNVANNKIEGDVEIANDSLAFLEELAPQISQVKGKLTGNMQFAGDPAKNLYLSGKITLQKTRFNIPQYGSEIRDLTLDIFAKEGNLIGFNGGARAGKGKLVINGSLNPAKRTGEIDIKGKNFQLTNSQKLKIRVDPDLSILFAEDMKIRGNIHVPSALIVPEITSSKITASEDVVLPKQKKEKKAVSSPVDANITVTLGDDVRVASADIETRLLGKLNIIAPPKSALTANGSISIKTGALRVYGQQLDIQRGRVIFGSGTITNPNLDIRATRNIDSENVIVGVNVLGNVKKPELSLFATPSMPDSSILSYLLFGRPPNSNSFSSAALLQTGGMVGANSVARDIRSSVGLDVLDFSLEGMEAGKNLSKKFYVGIRSRFFEAVNQFLVDYKVSARTHIKGSVGSDGMSIDLLKIIETD